MILTEQEANTKQCVNTQTRCFCVASKCMAWRWDTEETEMITMYTMGAVPDGEGWECTLSDHGRESFMVKSYWKRHSTPAGHCGLAGKIGM